MRNLLSFVFTLAYVFTLLSCEKETELVIDQSVLSFTDAGGSQPLVLTANKPWTASPSQSWCKVSPSAGEEAASSRISITCDPNTTYEPRNCTIIFTCAELVKEISIQQNQVNGLFVNTPSFEVSSSGGKVNLDVLTNVPFDVLIPDSAKTWIEVIPETKGLVEKKVTLDVKANPLYVDRSAELFVVENETHVKCPVNIHQSQLDAVFIDNMTEEGTAHDTTVAIKIRSNVDYSLSSDCKWMVLQKNTVSIGGLQRQEDGLVSTEMKVMIAYNDVYTDRIGMISVSSNGKAPDVTYKYTQSRFGFVVFDKDTYKTVKYGPSVWMVENLRTKYGQPESNTLDQWGSPKKSQYTYYWIQGEYGLLYSMDGLLYATAMQGKPLCPEGWHISTSDDWDRLFSMTKESNSSPYVLEKLGGKDTFSFGGNYGEWHSSSFWFNLEFGQPFPEWASISEQSAQVIHKATSYGPYPALNFRYLRCVKGPIIPEIQTLPVITATTTTAILRAEIMNDPTSSIARPYRLINEYYNPILKAGFKYGTTKDNLNAVVYSNDNDIKAEIKSLKPGTVYYYQPFVEYEGGDAPSYGNVMSFKTYDNILVYQGHNYFTTIFNDLEFMAQNLQATAYNDGTPIPYVKSDNDWASVTSPAQCIRANDDSLLDAYGRLYNQYAIENPKICPEGWRLPYHYELVKTRDEFEMLFGVPSGVYCLPDDTYWVNHTYCNNLSGLSVLPSERRSETGAFTETGYYGTKGFSAYFWAVNTTYTTVTDIIQITAQIGQDDYVGSWVGVGFDWGTSKRTGCAVRCVREK